MGQSSFRVEDSIDAFEVMDKIIKDGPTGTANFMRRCLRLDPEDMPSTKELLSDPWFDGVDK